MLRWVECGFHKICTGACYAELVFLHSVGCAGHALLSGASVARNFDALFFMLRWNQYRFNKKRTETRCTELVFLHPVGSAGHIVQSSASRA
jgi:hypothetical protein